MDWIIVIPSYKRAHTLREKTLKVLQEYQISSQQIYVVVASPEEKKVYEETLSPDTYNRILIADVGLHKARNFINLYFPTGQKIVEADDDISGFIEWDETAHRHEKRLGSLKETIEFGFSLCEKYSLRLWGLYPSPNGYFMRPKVSTDLRHIVGSFWGQINPGEDVSVRLQSKEDYERTLQFYELDGGVVRINSISPKTLYYKTPGGLQTSRTPESVEQEVDYLLKMFPDKVARNPRRKTGYAEIRLKKSF